MSPYLGIMKSGIESCSSSEIQNTADGKWIFSAKWLNRADSFESGPPDIWCARSHEGSLKSKAFD